MDFFWAARMGVSSLFSLLVFNVIVFQVLFLFTFLSVFLFAV